MRAPRETLALASLTMVVVGAFGPYLVGGARTEQLAVYGSLLMCLPVVLLRLRFNAASAHVAGLLLFLVGILVVQVVAPPVNSSAFESGSVVAGLDNALLPLAVLLLVQAWSLTGAIRESLLQRACLLLISLSCVNSVLSVLSIGGGLTPVLSRFWTAGGGAGSVAEEAAQLGRFSGIFNHPAEAGIMHGAALLAVLFYFRQRPAVVLIVGGIVAVGGVLTVSKVFMGVLPIFLWQFLRAYAGQARRLYPAALVVVALSAAAALGVTPTWAGAGYFTQLFVGQAPSVSLYTAGRFGESSSLANAYDAVLEYSPGFGFGPSGLSLPYDNAWIEALVVAGLAGGLCYTAILLRLFEAWRMRRAGPEGAFFGGLLLLVAGASLGVPALTANRVATVLWVLLGLLLLRPEARPPPNGRRETAPEPSQEQSPQQPHGESSADQLRPHPSGPV